jgi:hypothetical protein
VHPNVTAYLFLQVGLIAINVLGTPEGSGYGGAVMSAPVHSIARSAGIAADVRGAAPRRCVWSAISAASLLTYSKRTIVVQGYGQ